MKQIKIVFCLLISCAAATASQISAAGQATVGTTVQTQPRQAAAPNPISLPGADSRVYKTIGEVKLYLHVFRAPNAAKTDQKTDQKMEKLPAIVFFFFGG